MILLGLRGGFFEGFCHTYIRLRFDGHWGRLLVGRILSLSDDAQAKRTATQKANAIAISEWESQRRLDLVDEETFKRVIQPQLASFSIRKLAAALGVSEGYAAEIRKKRIPHARHWGVLANLVGDGTFSE